MTNMFITIKVMPESPDINFSEIRKKILKLTPKYDAKILDKDEIEPVAFGLNALKLTIILDENKGSEEITNEISEIEGVSSAEIVDMRRQIG